MNNIGALLCSEVVENVDSDDSGLNFTLKLIPPRMSRKWRIKRQLLSTYVNYCCTRLGREFFQLRFLYRRVVKEPVTIIFFKLVFKLSRLPFLSVFKKEKAVASCDIHCTKKFTLWENYCS
jgi:hypothetical protein